MHLAIHPHRHHLGLAPGRRVDYRFQDGLLTSVLPYYATTLTYHANITAQLADGITTESETYTYDAVSRLTRWTRAGVASETYGFDPFGNLINYNGRTLPVLDTTNRLAAAGYDASGHMTSGIGFSFTWDALDRMTALAGHGLHRRFAATADGERVVEREGSTYTFSLRGLDNRVLRETKATWTGAGWAWDWEKDSIWGAGRLLASVSRRDGLRHAHVDHLGSPRLLTNRCGQGVALLDHNPWGLDRPTGVQDGERHRFTAHQRDLGQLDRTWDDLDYMHARFYSPYLGRFASVDLLRGSPRRPQSFNLFGYVEGRPLSLVDPWGMQAFDLGLRDTIQVMGKDPCPEAPSGVSCEEYRRASQFMRRMMWESARQRAQEREDPMLTIMREVGSLARDATPPCHSMSFGQKWAINMDKTHGGFLGFALDPSVETGLKWSGRAVAKIPASHYVNTKLGWPPLLRWLARGLPGTISGGATFTGVEAGVLALGNTALAGVVALPAYAVGAAAGSAYQAWTAPCEVFW